MRRVGKDLPYIPDHCCPVNIVRNQYQCCSVQVFNNSNVLDMKMKKACVIPEILQGLSGIQLNQLLTGYRTTATQFPA